MQIPIVKLKAIIRYFGSNTDKRYLGKVKLMKLFYFLDFQHLKKYGTPITYDRYFHLDHGPIPSFIKNLVDELEENELKGGSKVLADTMSIQTEEGNTLHNIICKGEFTEQDKKYFSETELEILNNVATRFKKSNTKEIEKESHEEAPWKMTKSGDQIPYELAAHDSDCKTSVEEIRIMVEVAK